MPSSGIIPNTPEHGLTDHLGSTRAPGPATGPSMSSMKQRIVDPGVLTDDPDRDDHISSGVVMWKFAPRLSDDQPAFLNCPRRSNLSVSPRCGIATDP